MGIKYFHETYGERNGIERWFRTLKERTKKFYNNMIEDIAKAIALTYNLITRTRIEGVLPC